MSGQTIASLFVQIQPSFRGIAAELDKGLGRPLAQAGERAGDQAGKGFASRFEQSTGRSLDSVSSKGLVAFAGLSVGMFKAAGAAGNLNAAIAASEQVLGDASGAAQDWADDSVDAVGLSEAAALDASTSFGQLGKILGLTGRPLAEFSTGMVEAAADMAAFKDVPVGEALADLQSGFAGQTEVLRKYGIFFDEASLKAAYFEQTGTQVSGTLTAQQRILATHAAVMAQGADMWGQWDREADGWAATQSKATATLEQLGASIGQTALPALTGLLGAATSGAEGLSRLNESTGGAIGTLAMVGTAGLGAASAFGFTASKVSGMVNSFSAMSRAARLSTVAFGAVGLAASAAFLIYQGLGSKQREMDARTREVAQALGDQVRETYELAEASAGAAGEVDAVRVANVALSRALASTGDEGKKLTNALGAVGENLDSTIEVFAALDDSATAELQRLAEQAGLTATEAEYLARAVASTDDSFSKWATSSAGTLSELRETDPVLATLTEGLMEIRDGAAVVTPEMLRVGDALEELQDQRENADLNAQTQQFLANAAALDDNAEAALAAAEAQTGLSRNGQHAVSLYRAYVVELSKLNPEQRDAAIGASSLAAGLGTATDALTGATGATADLNTVAASTIEVMSNQERTLAAAGEAASAFSDALSRLAGSQIDVQAAQDDFNAGMDEINTTIAEAAKGTEGYTLSLDANTEEGRKNRDMIRQQAERVMSLGESMLDAGSSVGETSAAMTYNTAVLRNQLVAFGLTEAQADAYIATLGLTPENIDTAVNLYNDEAAKRRVEALIDTLGDIPETERTEIQALIDSGSYAEAERRLAVLTRQRSVSAITNYTPASGYSGTRSMAGNLFRGPGFTSVAEDGDMEWVAPLEKPALMRKWLSMPEIRGPVMAALGPMQVPSGRGNTSVTVNNHRSVAGPREIARGLALAGVT